MDRGGGVCYRIGHQRRCCVARYLDYKIMDTVFYVGVSSALSPVAGERSQGTAS